MNREERRALSVALSRRGDLLASVAAVATMLQVSWCRSSLALFVVFVMYDRIVSLQWLFEAPCSSLHLVWVLRRNLRAARVPPTIWLNGRKYQHMYVGNLVWMIDRYGKNASLSFFWIKYDPYIGIYVSPKGNTLRIEVGDKEVLETWSWTLKHLRSNGCSSPYVATHHFTI